jgi:nicotinate-nucleotide adenylyltransferase
MRIALFGGTFDPIHRGHLAIAHAAADALRLDRVLFAPTGHQPLKPDPSSAPYPHRLAMTALACAESDPTRFRLSEIDSPRPDHQPNYTVDTLADLADLHPADDLFAISGADSFHSLGRWKGTARLLDLAQWIVVSRPGYRLGDPDGYPLTPAQRTRVHLLDAVHDEVSSTLLRERLLTGDPCRDLLPHSVADYIQAHHLYR